MAATISLIAVLDRQVLALLVGPIEHDLAITDVQFSLLTGIAFSFFYAICGLPMGSLIDRISRVNILAIGLAIWSAATFASGFALSYVQLFLARTIVGVGEAVLQPATKSMITDIFLGRRLGMALSILALGSSVGGGAALLAGGRIIHAIGVHDFVHLPVIGDLKPWQVVMIVTGLPGLIIAPIARLTIREPLRRRTLINEAGVEAPASYSELGRFARKHWRTVSYMVVAYSVYSMAFQGLVSWVPAFLMRAHHMSMSSVGSVFGPWQIAANTTTMLASGWWIDRHPTRVDTALRCSRLAALIGLVSMVFVPFMSSTSSAMALTVLAVFGAAGYTVGSIPLMQLMPSQLRGKAMVSYQLISNIFSSLFGPTLVALLSDRVFRDPAMIGYSLSIVVSSSLAIAVLLLSLDLKPFRESIAVIAMQTR
jgi:MFS family permease